MNKFFLMVLLVLLSGTVFSQAPKSYNVMGGITSNLPASNSINEIINCHDTLWIGTGRGLSSTVTSGTTWTHFGGTSPFTYDGISAIGINDRYVWVAAATTYRDGDNSMPQGAGLFYSSDRGGTWVPIPQPVDAGLVDTIDYGINKIRSLAITTTVNNITYDIALTSSAIWTANFAGMLRKSTDDGKHWSKVVLPPDGRQSIAPTDSLSFDLAPTSGKSGLLGNLNHRVFSVFASNDSTIWVGTAGGINKSTDGGKSWRNFNHRSSGISGNFVVALAEQHFSLGSIIWAATVRAEGSDEINGVSYSTDGGSTWRTTLLGSFAHNISCRDSIVYVATDNGIYRSIMNSSHFSDFKTAPSWIAAGTMYDEAKRQWITTPEIISVGAQNEYVWIGTYDGLAKTNDSPSSPFGRSWSIYRAYQPVGTTSSTYSYPSPFSPKDEVVRIHYGTQGKSTTVSIRIFNFSMQPVKTLVRAAPRQSGAEYDDIWDGTDEHGSIVANGVYFYCVEPEGGEPAWGKIFLMK